MSDRDELRERVIAGRYALVRPLGEGAHGEVHEAYDRVAGVNVAIKLLRDRDESAARIRREVASLRILCVPGVVQLLDEGVDEGVPFIVMELARGAPFPGALAAPRAWASIAETTAALLGTLGRIHAAGVVHRDLKPSNVLVDEDGRPTILDFGIARFETPIAEGPTEDAILGTPAYLAPEQIHDRTIGPRADLYALGVMLYQALSGRLPFTAREPRMILYAKLGRRPPLLGDVAPGVPPHVASAVDQMLAIDPSERPRSAASLLRLLRGERDDGAHLLPWLGPRDAIDAIVRAARERRSLVVRGAPGSGRTRCFAEAQAALAGEGLAFVSTQSAGRPFGSLIPVTGPLDDLAEAPLAEVRAIVEAKTRAALEGGQALFVDDVDRVDRSSFSVIQRLTMVGSVIVAGDHDALGRGLDAITLGLIDERSMGALFMGPDRLLHLQEDGARVLAARTSGSPRSIAEETAAWVRAGLARWAEIPGQPRRIAMDREVLDGLMAGLFFATPEIAEQKTPLPPHLDDLLAWITLAWPYADRALLARAKREPSWKIEAEIEELCATGALRVHEDGRFELCARADESWTLERRAAAHRTLADLLPAGHPARLLHLVASEPASDDDIAREAQTLADRLAAEGHLGRAAAVLSEGLRAARRAASGAVERILASWVEVALAEGTPRALDRVLYEICRTPPESPLIHAIQRLVEAALGTGQWTDRALATVSAIPTFEDPRLERCRHAVRVAAARRTSLALEESVCEEAAAWAIAEGSAASLARLAGFRGRLAYRRWDFDGAARLHAEAAVGEPWVAFQLSAMLNSASARMEAFGHDEARDVAEAALLRARTHRHVLHELRAEWVLRSVDYRSERACAPDLEFVEAAGHAGIKHMEALVCLNEAAVAWRAGARATRERGVATNVDRVTARALAERAACGMKEVGDRAGALLSCCLAAVNGAPLDGATGEDLLACKLPRIRLQAAGLLAMARAEGLTDMAPPALDQDAILADIPIEHRGKRMEVVSADEALAALSEPR